VDLLYLMLLLMPLLCLRRRRCPSNDGWAMSEGVMRVLWPFAVVFWDFAC
jgi:hypothetical protein